jgi:Phage integrase family
MTTTGGLFSPNCHQIAAADLALDREAEPFELALDRPVKARLWSSLPWHGLSISKLEVGLFQKEAPAQQDEIHLDEGVWTVPAERMKAGKEHQVPLSKRAIAILERLPRERGGYLFPGAKAKSPLSNMAMLELLRGMNGNDLTVHGFRSTFRDWAGDRTNYAREVIEHALAHRIRDKAEASCRRSDALEKRRRPMEAWARYCESPATAQVVALR